MTNLPIRLRNQISDIGFALHRERGPEHVPDFHPHVIGGCSCLADAMKQVLEKIPPAAPIKRRIKLED